MGANLPDETTGPEGPLIPSSGCRPAGGFLVTLLPNCYQKCPQSDTKLWQFSHFSGTCVTSTRRKLFRIKRGRRDSNPQPPDRQDEPRTFRNPLPDSMFRDYLTEGNALVACNPFGTFPDFRLPSGSKEVHSCEFTKRLL